MLQSERVTSDNPKPTLERIPGRLRTQKEAADLLQILRVGYQSLSPGKRQEVKHLMSWMFESQRQSSALMFERAQPAIESRTN